MIVQLQADRLLKPCIEEIPNFSTYDKSNLPDESWSEIKIELFLNINRINE